MNLLLFAAVQALFAVNLLVVGACLVTWRQIDELRAANTDLEDRVAHLEGRARVRVPLTRLRAVDGDDEMWEPV